MCDKANNRSIDLPRIRDFEFSPEEPEGTEGAEEMNEQAENESETTSSQISSAPSLDAVLSSANHTTYKPSPTTHQGHCSVRRLAQSH